MSKRRLVIGGEEVVAPAESPKPSSTVPDSGKYSGWRGYERVEKNRHILRKLIVEKVCPVCERPGYGIIDNSTLRKTVACSCGAYIEVYGENRVQTATIIVDESRCTGFMIPENPTLAQLDAMAAARDMGLSPRAVRDAMSQQAAESPRARNGQTQYREADNVLIAKFLSRLVCPDCTGKQLLTRRTQPNTTKFMCQDCPMTIELEWSGDFVKNGPIVRRLNEE